MFFSMMLLLPLCQVCLSKKGTNSLNELESRVLQLENLMGQMQRSCRRYQYQPEGKCLALLKVCLNTGMFVIVARFLCFPKKEEHIILHIFWWVIRQCRSVKACETDNTRKLYLRRLKRGW